MTFACYSFCNFLVLTCYSYFSGSWIAKSGEHLFSQFSTAVFDVYRAFGCIFAEWEA